jgi:thiosulfate dehydrogenase
VRSVLLALLAVACGEPTPDAELVALGRELVWGGSSSSAAATSFRCTTCHDLGEGGAASQPGRPGALLAGVTLRPSYWGGQEVDLLRAIEACRRSFLLLSEPLSERDEAALYAYLRSLEPGSAEAVAFTVERWPEELPRGDAERGGALYAGSCLGCHGSMHTGEGRLSNAMPVLPETVQLEHQDETPRWVRLHFIEKVRHGGFFEHPGTMPPFSLEALSDGGLSDVLEALSVLGE